MLKTGHVGEILRTLARISVPRGERGRSQKWPLRIIADRGYDSDGLRWRLLLQAGLCARGRATLSVIYCALINNTNLGGWGGAILNSGDLYITNSILSRNQNIAAREASVTAPLEITQAKSVVTCSRFVPN